jgi:hypothetical protein
MFRSTTIIRELALSLAKVIFILKHSVKLRRYMLFGDVAACHRAECVLCAVQNALHKTAACKTTPSSFAEECRYHFLLSSCFRGTVLQRSLLPT